MNTVKVPTDRQIWEGEIATYWMDNGILVSLSKPTRRTVALIRDNVALVKSIPDHKPVPLLIYSSNSPIAGKATRKYSTEQLPVIYTAIATISEPGLLGLIMNILFR